MSRDANLLAAMALAVAAAVDEATAEHTGLDRPGPEALITVHTRPGLTIAELSLILALSHSGTVRVVDRLERQGLVERHRSGRTVALRLSRRGARAAEGALKARARIVDALLDELPAAARLQLVETTALVLGRLTTSRFVARHICRLCDQGLCGSTTGECPVDAAATRYD